MRIESIKINNLRQFQDIYLRFDSNRVGNDLNIILAENGLGKTNILNAITWCLYGKELHLRDERNALAIVNNKLVNDKRINGGGPVEISVELEISIDQEKNKIFLKRTGNFNVTKDDIISVNNTLTVKFYEDGGLRILDDIEQTQQIIHQYLPEEINSYIFFDGEQLEKFFSHDLLERVREGINQFTQATYLSEVSDYLRNYIKQSLSPQIANCGDCEIQDKQNEIDKKNSSIDESKSIIDETKKQISSCENEIETLDRRIQGYQNLKDKTAELKNCEDKLNQLNTEQKDNFTEIIKFTRNYYTLFAMYPSLKKYQQYILNQENLGNLPPSIDKKILSQIIATKHCPICDTANLSETNLEFVKKLENSIALANKTSAILNQSRGFLSGYFDQINSFSSEKEHLIKEEQNIEKEVKTTSSRYESLQQYIRTIPNNEEIVKAIDKRSDYKDQLERLYEKKGIEEANLKKLISEKEQLENDLKKLLDKTEKLNNIKKQISFCHKMIDIMSESKDEILRDCRSKIQEKTYQIFSSLIWKKDAYSKVVIDENYNFSLLDRFGYQSLGSCSAAETALLALSFTIALQEVSKHDSLLFIDTPIGRIDSENRENFMDTLLRISQNKQVILTFTPTEYDNNVQEKLNGNFRSFYKIIMNDGVSSIEQIK